ncbi:translation initiation factor 1 [Pancytospora epiphaga]|nr:translation initiation factor 1 [Pancytospora epiphaga]
MDTDFSDNAVLITIKKVKNSYLTQLENVPTDKIDQLLSACRSKFGCGGNINRSQNAPVLVLNGDQKFNIERTRTTIFEGLELRMKDKR